jgi:hypothetical protein
VGFMRFRRKTDDIARDVTVFQLDVASRTDL